MLEIKTIVNISKYSKMEWKLPEVFEAVYTQNIIANPHPKFI